MAELNYSPGKSGGKRSVKRISAHVDLTAMVDLAFLLITFFMLTTVLTKPKAMPVIMPVKGPDGAVPETRSMTICLGKNNHVLYFLGLIQKPLIGPAITNGGQGMRAAILQMNKHVLSTTGKSMIVVLKPSDHSVYANLVDALDELKITQAPTYAIAQISPTDVELLTQKGIY